MKAYKPNTNNEVNPMKDDTRLALLEQTVGNINETMLRLERKMDLGFEKVDKRFDNIDKDIREIRSLSWSHFKWMMSAVLGLFGTIATVIVKGHMA